MKVTNISIAPVLCATIEQAIEVLANNGYAVTNPRYHVFVVTDPQGDAQEMRRSQVINLANHKLPAIEHRTEPGTHFAPFPELDKDQNALIQRARDAGFALFFPAVPNAKAQALNTFTAAREYISANTTANKKSNRKTKGHSANAKR